MIQICTNRINLIFFIFSILISLFEWWLLFTYFKSIKFMWWKLKWKALDVDGIGDDWSWCFHATSKSDDESSASLYAAYMRFECPSTFFGRLLLLTLAPVKPLNVEVDSFKLHFNEPLFKWSSCSFLRRSFSSRLFLRNLARRFLNHT